MASARRTDLAEMTDRDVLPAEPHTAAKSSLDERHHAAPIRPFDAEDGDDRSAPITDPVVAEPKTAAGVGRPTHRKIRVEQESADEIGPCAQAGASV